MIGAIGLISVHQPDQIGGRYTHSPTLHVGGANRGARLNAYISVNAEYNAVNVQTGEYPISRGYDLQAIYETVAKEGGGRCPQ